MNSSGELTNTFSKSSLPNCPFAFDDEDEYTVTSVQSKNTLASSVGSVRVGGSKEARLRRTAIVGDSEDLLIESLYGVRVDNVPERIPREVLLEDFEKFGKVGDFKMLLTRAGRNRGQAFVRFYSAEDAHSACEHMTGKIYKAYHAFDDKKGLVCELAQHQSFFSNNTGALGIANVPTGEIAVRENVQIKQDVSYPCCLYGIMLTWILFCIHSLFNLLRLSWLIAAPDLGILGVVNMN